ncbi:MAG: hypothetical protein HFH30_06920 [Eubacterium sp.]|nr:hypothetical protein [Eubacterium sp.]
MNIQMTKQKQPEAGIQACRIEFGSDDYLYSVSFKAAIDRREINRMLYTARSSLYENVPEAIRLYMDTHCLRYSDFTAVAARQEHDTVMAAAGCLLHCSSCDSLDRLARGADAYYGIMDYQHRTGSSCCEGCYCAVSRIVSRQNGTSDCRIIGQIFQYDTSSGREKSFFAIRKNEGRNHMHTLEAAAGCPVLPLFGCVDMAVLLAGICSVTTKEQAARLANR